jgi:cyclopropane fatty-acyl-phospholipid synthase-like methyltransferase
MLKSLGKQLRKPSGMFGKLVSLLLQVRNKQFYIKIIRDLELKKGDKIFEIGYGPGAGIHMITKNTKDCVIHGIDFSELMYNQAVKRNKKFIDTGNVKLSFGDFLALTPELEKYHKIFCVNVIYFWSDLNFVFKKIHAMLEKDGIFCIYMAHAKDLDKNKFTSEFNKYSIEKVVDELKLAGFLKVSFDFVPGYYIKAIK